MSVIKRDLFASTQVEPTNSELQSPAVQSDVSTSGALGDETAHGDVSSYESTRSRVIGEKGSGSAGFGIGGDTDSGFSTRQYNSSDTPNETFGDVQPGRLVLGDYSHGGQSGDTGSNSSGYGKVIK